MGTGEQHVVSVLSDRNTTVVRDRFCVQRSFLTCYCVVGAPFVHNLLDACAGPPGDEDGIDSFAGIIMRQA